jgi:hypothetical protein
MRSGVEEYIKEKWRRWRFISFDHKLDCLSMVVSSSSFDLLPCPTPLTILIPFLFLNETSLLFLRRDFLTA